MLDSLQKRLGGALKSIRGKTNLSEADVDKILSEVRTGFLEADVHFRVTKDFLARVKERCLREEVMKSLSPEQQIVTVLSDELTQILGGENRDLAGLFLVGVVTHACTGGRGAKPIIQTQTIEQRIRQRGLPASRVSHDREIPHVFDRYVLHMRVSPFRCNECVTNLECRHYATATTAVQSLVYNP